MTQPAQAADTAYACIRIVKASPGDATGHPLVKVPPGYRLNLDSAHAMPSPSEYYLFIEGPRGIARGVEIEWPGQRILTVLHNHDRLPLRADSPAKVTCDVPVTAATEREAWTTLETWSWLDEPGLWFALHHNDESRRCGWYLERPWIKPEAAAMTNWLLAARLVLRDWGLPRLISSDGAGQMALMGFESNNPLHGDSPPHFHMAYFWPEPDGHPSWGAKGSQVPHLYLDSLGRVVENGFMVIGQKWRTVRPAEIIEFKDPTGAVRFAMQIRTDGGIDLGPKSGTWTYSLRAGDDSTGFTRSIRILKNAEPWRRVTCTDDTRAGRTEILIDALDGSDHNSVEVIKFDPLTGVIDGK